MVSVYNNKALDGGCGQIEAGEKLLLYTPTMRPRMGLGFDWWVVVIVHTNHADTDAVRL
jgi:hypothetical protein